jgi:hypothetical protein
MDDESDRVVIIFPFKSICLVYFLCLVNLLSVRTSLCETSLTTSGLAEHDIAVSAQYYGLCVAENCCDLKASWALDVHEKGIGRLHKSLQLVGVGFTISSGVQKIDRHFCSIL